MLPVDNRRVKLSVMMITYNHERFIAQALESVLAQRVDFEYEIVVGEDCSTDGTRAILADFHRRYPERIVPLLRTENLGLTQNMISTIDACKGTYLACLEGDDYWIDENKLQKQVDFLDQHPDFAICCHRVRFLDEIKGLDFVYPNFAAGPYTIEDLLKSNFVLTSSVVLRRAAIGILPSWFLGLALGDWPLFALVAKQGKIELLDRVMSTYRLHSGGTWSSRPHLSRLSETARMLTALDRHLDFKYTDTIRQTVAQGHLDLAIIHRESGNRAATGNQLLACMRSGGWRLPARTLGGLAAYALIGNWYKVFSRAKSAG
jgi:glycosyltransferase involved in cell wall biosynthesis